MSSRNAVVEKLYDNITKLCAEWQRVNSGALRHVTGIINIITDVTHVQGEEWTQLCEGLDLSVEAKLASQLRMEHAKLRRAHTKLYTVLQAMQAQASKLQQLPVQLPAQPQQQEKEQQPAPHEDAGSPAPGPVFSTAPLGQLRCVMAEMIEMYHKEIGLKAAILQDLPVCRDRDTLTIYASTWVLQPFIDTVRAQELRSLLKADIDAHAVEKQRSHVNGA